MANQPKATSCRLSKDTPCRCCPARKPRRGVKPVAVRFWAMVKHGPGCWLWQGATSRAGYGVTRDANQKWIYAHRLSWWLTQGSPKKLWVLHRCDTPACVRPEHLFLGTPADNSRDRNFKGRGAVFPRESNPMAKLTESSVNVIRNSHKGYGTGRKLAKRFRVSEATISDVRHGKSWKL